jgi:hypothetical protein
MRRGLWVAVIGWGGCDVPPSDFPDVAGFGACVGPEGGWTDSSQQADVTGEVSAVGAGDAPDGCSLSDTTVLLAGEPSAADMAWLSIVDGEGSTWTAAFAVPAFAEPFSVGDTAHVLCTWRPPEFSTGDGSLELRNDAEAPVLWVGSSDGVDTLHPADGVALSAGEVVARRQDECGTVEARDLVTTLGSDSVSVPYGGSGTVGDLVVHHGGLDVASGGGRCLDWAPSVARVAIDFTP